MADDSLLSVDVDAIGDAISALSAVDVHVDDVRTVQMGDSGQVQFVLDCHAHARDTTLGDFGPGPDADGSGDD